jgi:hypothetical protein
MNNPAASSRVSKSLELLSPQEAGNGPSSAGGGFISPGSRSQEITIRFPISFLGVKIIDNRITFLISTD